MDSVFVHSQSLLIVISGASGAGKDSVIKRMKERNLPFHFVVTVNTRAPRPGEQHGVDYWFISREEFLRMRDAGELLEHAQVYNDFKGIPKEQVRRALSTGKDVVMRVDVQGAATVKRLCPAAVLVFITTRNEQELIERLKKRSTETPEDLQRRIAELHQELQCAQEFDYVVINPPNQIDDAVDAVLAIITAEHLRTNLHEVCL